MQKNREFFKIRDKILNDCRKYVVEDKQLITQEYIQNQLVVIDDKAIKRECYEFIISRLQKSLSKIIKRLIEASIHNGQTINNDSFIKDYGSLLIDDKFLENINNFRIQCEDRIKRTNQYLQEHPEVKDLFKIIPTQVNDKWVFEKTLICPHCGKKFDCSTYLAEIFESMPKVEWLANMVTHYRHDHLTSWNKCWGPGGGYYRRGWFRNYDDEKSKVNERQKRQIIRQCKQFLIDHNFTVSDFEQLQGTTDETTALAKKYLKDE